MEYKYLKEEQKEFMKTLSDEILKEITESNPFMETSDHERAHYASIILIERKINVIKKMSKKTIIKYIDMLIEQLKPIKESLDWEAELDQLNDEELNYKEEIDTLIEKLKTFEYVTSNEIFKIKGINKKIYDNRFKDLSLNEIIGQGFFGTEISDPEAITEEDIMLLSGINDIEREYLIDLKNNLWNGHYKPHERD